MATVLITGGAGNLARYVAAELAPAHHVILFDRVSPAEAMYSFTSDHPFVQGELTSRDDCARVVAQTDPDVIVHLAAIPTPTDHPEVVARMRARGLPELPEDETFRVNVLGTFHLLDAARRHGVRKIVAASSYFTIGLGFRLSPEPFQVDYLPFDEEHPSRPEDSYSLSKLINEETYQAFARAYGVQTVALRLLRVTFPHRDNPAEVFDIQPPTPLGIDFLTWIEYVDARDAAQAVRLALEADHLPMFDTFFIGTDVTVREDPRALVLSLYPELREKAAGWQDGDLPISIEKARKVLGYNPQHSWKED